MTIHETQPNDMREKPLVSFVIVGRNDNYGGNFIDRLQVYMNVLVALCTKYELPTEIVVVDWNPPYENPPLHEAVKIPLSDYSGNIDVRFIEVPHEVHRTFPNSDRMPLFEYPGKNVGIRRASGEYIVATNPDIIFSEELIKFLSSADLSPEKFYRSTRIDVTSLVYPDASVEEILDHCRKNIIRINGYSHSYTPGLFNRFNPLSLYHHTREKMKYSPYSKPFTNASGDFLMLHREKWFELHGYPEIGGVDKDGLHHSDSFMVHMALFHGLKQVCLKAPIYHQEHGINLSTRPYAPEVTATRKKLLNDHTPMIFNDNSWGIPGYDFVENHI